MTLTNHRRAFGTFSSHQEVENALNELKDSGFMMNQVSVIAKDTESLDHSDRIGETRVQEVDEPNRADDGAKAGAGAGSVVGGLTGLLVGLGSLAIPGVGPIMLAGATATTIATTLAGGAIGAAAGSLLGGLIGLGIPEERARNYHDQLIQGDYLLIIDGSANEIALAESILKRRGIRDWHLYITPITGDHAASVAR